jgi:hypothetical protein
MAPAPPSLQTGLTKSHVFEQRAEGGEGGAAGGGRFGVMPISSAARSASSPDGLS